MSRIEEAAVKAAQTAELLRQDILDLSRVSSGTMIQDAQDKLAQIACEDLLNRAAILMRDLKAVARQ